MVGVTAGTICGMSLKYYSAKSWSDRDIMYIKFPGEVFLRMVNCLILPLVTSSIISATCNLSKSGKIHIDQFFFLIFNYLFIKFSRIFKEKLKRQFTHIYIFIYHFCVYVLLRHFRKKVVQKR